VGGEEGSEQKLICALNQTTFHELAMADAPVHIARSTDDNGDTIPGGFCLYIQGAQSADLIRKETGPSQNFRGLAALAPPGADINSS
jgi:hypothetical protein